MENFTTTESADCNCMENSPFKDVKVALPCERTDTVASSTGFKFWSVTRP